jgi:hypothetical protein
MQEAKMSTAPVFILLSNDGDEDMVLTCDAKLHTKLQHIRDYNTKLKMQGKLPANSSVQPQVADVTETHNLWVHRRFYPYVALSHTFVPTQVNSGNATLAAGGNVTFDMQYAGEFYNKVCLHLVISSGTIGLNGAANQYFAYSPFLGHKIVKDAEFIVNTSILDKYDSKAAQSRFEFDVKESARDGYSRCIGQQTKKTAKVNQFVSTVGLTTRTTTGAADGQVPANGVRLGSLGYEEEVTIYDGPQTRKQTHDQIELFIPLWFWWNRESEESLCVLTIPNGQRNIKFNFEQLSNLVQMYDLNGNAIAYDAAKWTTAPSLTTQELLVQNIYVNPEINDVYIDRIGFNMVRLHRYQETILNSSQFNERLSNLKWPVEELRVAALPRANTLGTAIEDAFTFGYVSPQPIIFAGRWQADPSLAVTVPVSGVYRKSDDLITTLTLTIQGMQLYNAFPAKFFRDYTPAVFSEVVNRAAPRAAGWHLINIAEKPGHSQANGHFNISRMRETYLAGTTANIPTNVDQASLYILAICLNFTFVTNGNIIIRFIG